MRHSISPSVIPTAGGVVIGSGIGGLHEIEEQHNHLFDKGPTRVSPFMIPKLMVNAASGNVSVTFGLRGPNTAVATACASASNAIGDAFKIIQNDMADVMIAGGPSPPSPRWGFPASPA
jgi:3-oxoacyl-[acyl-carrier-protein] synthase II